MNHPRPEAYIQLLLLLAYVIPAIFFFLTQQRTLILIRGRNRRIRPAQVWLQLIPIGGLIWQFIVITRISDSIRDELNKPTDDSIFAEDAIPQNHRPTYKAGITYATLCCLTIVVPIPLLQILTGSGGLAAWIYYWIQLAGCKKRLKERVLLLNP